ncbi:MAG: twin-arginine translocase TatA/TatE family subunit [Planctomycetota bacterium]|jgi:TatA/E family protein of Tat protein translocase
MTLAFFGSIGPAEIVLIVLILVVLFGRRLPEVGRSVGKTLFQVRKGINEMKGDFYDATGDIREEVKATERDLNRVLNEPPKPAAVDSGDGADEKEDSDEAGKVGHISEEKTESEPTEEEKKAAEAAYKDADAETADDSSARAEEKEKEKGSEGGKDN